MADISTKHPQMPRVSLTPNATFYFEDLYISVEHSLFKVLRRDFEAGSQVFREMFKLPTGAHPVEGSCAERPLVLGGIKVEEMNDFLSVLYALPSNVTPLDAAHQWITVLRLALLWDFAEIKMKAIEALSAAGPCVKIQVYNLFPELTPELKEEWFASSVRVLVKRPEELTAVEVELIGVEKALKICYLRGEFFAFHDPNDACTKLDSKIKAKFVPELASWESCEPFDESSRARRRRRFGAGSRAHELPVELAAILAGITVCQHK